MKKAGSKGTPAILLTRRELKTMNIVWELGTAATPKVWEITRAEDKVAYTTVITQLGVLEKKGLLTHKKVGRRFLYTPCVSRHEVTVSHIRDLLQQYFNNDSSSLIRYLSEEFGDSTAISSGVGTLKNT